MAGITYVMTHPGYQSVKVGHTGAEGQRVHQLVKHGWHPYRHLHSISIEQARAIEQATLFYIRFRLGVPVHLTRAHMGHAAGWTETSSASLITAREAWEHVCEHAALEQLAPIVASVPPVRPYRPIPPRRQKGDTPRYVRAARVEAARTAHAYQVGAWFQQQSKTAQKDPS